MLKREEVEKGQEDDGCTNGYLLKAGCEFENLDIKNLERESENSGTPIFVSTAHAQQTLCYRAVSP